MTGATLTKLTLRSDPDRLRFEIVARDGDARAGILHTPHGPIETPCFVPLATRGSVKGLLADEVAGIGYEIVLGNTYHLMLAPGGERIAALGGLHGFMGWDRAIITDSGGFQVFSLAHGSVADEVKGRRGRPPLAGGVLGIGEEGVRFRSYIDGSEQFLSPERSMEIQAQLGSDIALVFDECTPFHADRDYTARIDRADASLARPMPRLACRERARRAGRLRDRPGRHPRGPAAPVGRRDRGRRSRRDRDRRHARRDQGADARGRRD